MRVGVLALLLRISNLMESRAAQLLMHILVSSKIFIETVNALTRSGELQGLKRDELLTCYMLVHGIRSYLCFEVSEYHSIRSCSNSLLDSVSIGTRISANC